MAPMVVNPPCASRSAWKMRTMSDITDVTPTPKNMVENPVPVGWDDEPVTEGSLKEDMTKMNAPDRASMVLWAGSSCNIFRMLRKP